MPKHVDAGTQRRKITAAAIAVIGTEGLEGARLRDVARAADVTTGAVMHYFDDKDAVLEAALEAIVERTLQRMATPSTTTPGDVPTFVGRTSRYLPLDAAGREEWRVWLAFWGRAIATPRLLKIHQRYYQQIVDHLLVPLRALAPDAVAASEDTLRACADAVVAAIDGVGTRATLDPDRWPASRQRQTLHTLLEPVLAAFASNRGGVRPDA